MATFLKNINMVARSATRFLDLSLQNGCALKGFHSKYLLAICNSPGLSQDAIAKRLFVNKSNVARQLAALEKEGYVTRSPDPSDKRVSLVYPSEKALSVLPVIRAANTEWRGIITEGFTEGEKEILSALTARLYENAVKYMERTYEKNS